MLYSNYAIDFEVMKVISLLRKNKQSIQTSLTPLFLTTKEINFETAWTDTQ